MGSGGCSSNWEEEVPLFMWECCKGFWPIRIVENGREVDHVENSLDPHRPPV